MAETLTTNITNLQEKVIGPARKTLKDDALAIKRAFHVVRGRAGMDDTYNWPKMPGVTAYGLIEGMDMVTETLIDSNTAVSATEVGVAVKVSNKALRTTGDKILRFAGQAMGSAINVKEEQDAATLVDGFGNAVGVDGGSATLGHLSAANAQLRGNTEPVVDGMFKDVNSVITPYMWHDLAQLLFPTGSGDSHAPMAAQTGRAAEGVMNRYFPKGEYFGVPIWLSSNLVASGTNTRAGVWHKEAGIIYDFMPVEVERDDIPKTGRAVTLSMVVDYGFAEANDGFGREWDADNTAPTS